MAGMMQLSRELAVFIAPNINSYKRYASLSWAPVNVVWGRDNRTTGFRLVGRGSALHVEDRFPGGDMNAYLTYAAMIGAGLGIEHELALEPEYKGNGYVATGCGRMPRRSTKRSGSSSGPRRGGHLRPGRRRPLPQCGPGRAAGL
jgi:glutamine synthetase